MTGWWLGKGRRWSRAPRIGDALDSWGRDNGSHAVYGGASRAASSATSTRTVPEPDPSAEGSDLLHGN